MSSPRPTPKFFAEPQTFSTKKARATPKEQGPPRPPVKSAPPISRIFSRPINQKARAISFKASDASLYNKHYNEGAKELYFEQCFDIISKLGAGSFGDVYKARSKVDGNLYAVKRSRERFRGESDRLRKLEEVKKHEELPKHSNCISFVKAWEERQHLYIQTELCSTSLSNYAEANHDIPETLVWKFLLDLLLAVKHLHNHDLLHLDIKPDNIFVSSDGICKLGDFGLVIDLSKREKFEALEGDPKYLAPEVLEGHFTKAADIFSLGITILELACDLDLPRGGDSWQQLRHGQIPKDMCSTISDALRSVISLMMEPNYLRRPTADQILSLPAVAKVHKKRRIDLQMKLMLSATISILSVLWVHLTAFAQVLVKPLIWLKEKCVRVNQITGTPVLKFGSKQTNLNNWQGWDASFSDDEVFEDELNSSHNLGVSPLSDTSTSDESRNESHNGSFFIPSVPFRLLNSTPAHIKHRSNIKKSVLPTHLFNDRIERSGENNRHDKLNRSLFSSPERILRSNFKKNLANDSINNSSIEPRNLMDVFNATNSEDDT